MNNVSLEKVDETLQKIEKAIKENDFSELNKEDLDKTMAEIDSVIAITEEELKKVCNEVDKNYLEIVIDQHTKLRKAIDLIQGEI